MPWNNWVVRKSAGDTPPIEWEEILTLIKGILSDEYIDKIELTAFVIKGHRKARWTLENTDPEYCTKNEALHVAVKLLWLLLLSKNAPQISTGLKEKLACSETPHCKLFMGHENPCIIEGNIFNDITRCQLCKKTLALEDFDRDGRKDAYSIQMAHHTPLSRGTRQHNARNISWAHRCCNQIQSEQTLDEAVRNLKTILEAHGFSVSLQ